jgi:hypothetical protein
MRRPLVALPIRDARKIDQVLTTLDPQPLDEVIGFYAQWWKTRTP